MPVFNLQTTLHLYTLLSLADHLLMVSVLSCPCFQKSFCYHLFIVKHNVLPVNTTIILITVVLVLIHNCVLILILL